MPRNASVAGGVVALVITALLGVAAPGANAQACAALTGTPVGSPYTVPATGVSEVVLDVSGQAGQDWISPPGNVPGQPTQMTTPFDLKGGLGSRIRADVAVTPGEVFQAGTLAGGAGGVTPPGRIVPAGDGSSGGDGGFLEGAAGGKGGDAEYVTLTAAAPGSCPQLVLVAAGGGGAGGGGGQGDAQSGEGGFGGNADAGSGATGGGDAEDNSDHDGGHGGPATSTGGGSGGAHGRSAALCRNGNDGQGGGFESGGSGGAGHTYGVPNACGQGFGAGGGGGGYYYGGGGGSGYEDYPSGGGGGGSSYVMPGITLVAGAQSLIEQPGPVGIWSFGGANANQGLITDYPGAVPNPGGGLVGPPTVTAIVDTSTALTSSRSPSGDGQPVTFTATVSTADGSALAGGVVRFTGPGFDNVTTNPKVVPLVIASGASSGTASLTTSSLPDGTDHIAASYGGSSGAGTVDRPTLATKLDQVVRPAIHFTSSPPSPVQAGRTTYVVAATDTAGLPVSFSIDPAAAAVCSISGATVSFLTGETCVIDADQAATAAQLAATTAVQDVSVNPLIAQAVTFTSTPPASTEAGDAYVVAARGGASGNPVTFSASGPCNYEGSDTNRVQFQQGGVCRIFASQAGGGGYASGGAEQDVTIGAGTDQILFFSTPPSDAVPGDTYALSAVSQRFVRVTFAIDATSFGCTKSADDVQGVETLATITFTAPGTCVIDATTAGSPPKFLPASGRQTITVRSPQAIRSTTASGQPAPTFGGTFMLSAAGGGSGQPVTFTSATPGICTEAGGETTFVGVGNCQILGHQVGNASFAPAPTAFFNIGVARAPLTFVAPDVRYVLGSAIPASFSPTVTGFVLGDTGAVLTTPVTCSSPFTPDKVQAYTLVCTSGAEGNYVIPALQGTLTVFAPVALTVAAPSADYVYGTGVPGSFTPAYGGFLPEDDESSLGRPATCAATGAVSGVGAYAITCSGAASADYTFTYTTGLLTILPAIVSVTAPGASYVDGTSVPASFTPAYTGLASGQSSPATPPTCVPTTPVTGVGVYTIACSGAADPNYRFTYTAGQLTITPAPGPSVITGTVTDAAGTGLANVCVHPYDATTGARTADAAACTDAAGVYALSLAAAGSYDVVFYDASGGFVTQWYSGGRNVGQATRVSVASGRSRTGIDAVMKSSTAASEAITGTVRTAAGVGVADICVYPYDSATGTRTVDAAVCTDASGAYALRLAAAGSYTVFFYDPSGVYVTQWYGGTPYAGRAIPVVVAAGAPTTGIDAILASPTEITGKVTDAAGHGIPNICVYPFEAATGDRTADPAACTDAGGVYTLSVSAGSYNIVFYDPSGLYTTQWSSGAQYEGQATPVTVGSQARATGVDATLTQ